MKRYVRQGDKTWTYSEYQEPGDVVQLSSICCSFALKDLYAKITP